LLNKKFISYKETNNKTHIITSDLYCAELWLTWKSKPI